MGLAGSFIIAMRKAKTKYLYIIIGLLFIVNALIFLDISLRYAQTAQPNKAGFVSNPAVTGSADSLSILSLDGFVRAEIEIKPDLLLVKNGCKGIPMTPTEQQIRSIASAINNQSDFRPSTHDLMKEVIDSYGIQVVQSKIVEADESEEVYYARIVVRQGDKVLNLDSKPSDAIAMALRFNIPVYIKQDILNRKGQDVCTKII